MLKIFLAEDENNPEEIQFCESIESGLSFGFLSNDITIRCEVTTVVLERANRKLSCRCTSHGQETATDVIFSFRYPKIIAPRYAVAAMFNQISVRRIPRVDI